jgi:hypothetical protein
MRRLGLVRSPLSLRGQGLVTTHHPNKAPQGISDRGVKRFPSAITRRLLVSTVSLPMPSMGSTVPLSV